MGRKKAEPTQFYKSACCGLGNAVTTANEWHAEGYEVSWCFAVVANDEEGKPVQAVWMLGKKREG
jgi:hypothetical protein